MKFLTLFTAAMVIATLAMVAVANAHPKPRPKPPMDCFVVEDSYVDCEVRK